MIRRLCAGTAVCLAAVLLLAACAVGPSGRGGTASGARTQSPAAPSGAQTLRVSIDLAFSAHTLMLARTTDAAFGVRTTEFSTYGTALHAHDAVVAVALAPGNAAQQDQLSTALTLFDRGVLNDATATFTKNTSQQQQARSALRDSYLPQMRTALEKSTHASSGTVTAGLRAEIGDAEALVAAQGSGNWTAAYTGIATAVAQQIAFGTELTQALARTSPQTYPGNPTTRAATLRVRLETGLQSQVYLLGLEESAMTGSRSSEQQAAATAYAASVTAVSAVIQPGSKQIANGLSGELTQLQTSATQLTSATAQKQVSGVTSNRQALVMTFPQDYQVIAHTQLGIPTAQASQVSRAYGQSLGAQAAAEGSTLSTPRGTAAAAAAGATLGRQVGAALAETYRSAFPNH